MIKAKYTVGDTSKEFEFNSMDELLAYERAAKGCSNMIKTATVELAGVESIGESPGTPPQSGLRMERRVKYNLA